MARIHRRTIQKRFSVQFSHSVVSDCDPMDCSMPGFSVHHRLLELVQTHVHQVGDVIQLISFSVPFCSCLQSFPASGSLPMSQFFTSGVQSIGVSASEVPLELNGLISLQSKGLSRVFSNTIVQKHQFFCTQPSL